MTTKERLVTGISYLKNDFKRETITLAKEFENKIGIEIGGPSSSFGLKSFFPIYLYAKKIDGVNFSNETVWEGKIAAGNNYRYKNDDAIGYQYIDEGAELNTVSNDKYDFLLSCHSLEHVANPIKTIKRWSEVLKPKGRICLILPDKRFTFDNKRPYTTFEHLLNDFNNNVEETDTTHIEEVIQLHDLTKDIPQSRDEFVERTRNNVINRCVHHHVFSFELINELFNYCNFKIIINKEFAPFHLFAVAEKN